MESASTPAATQNFTRFTRQNSRQEQLNPQLRIKTVRRKQGKDRKSTRLNSSHMSISYAVFCLKKNKRARGRPLRFGVARRAVSGGRSTSPPDRTNDPKVRRPVSDLEVPSLDRLRCLSIIDHIDHGNSTLADRMLEIHGAVEARDMRAQYLDSMDIERERGIFFLMMRRPPGSTLFPYTTLFR